MDIKLILKEFKQEVSKLYEKKLNSIILYGSWARGKATEDSDIDLAIVLEGNVIAGREIDRMIDIITDINLKYGVLLSVYPVSKKDYATVNSPLILNIRKEGVAA
ncbi:MAG: nucleotidyltransferase domain-containing protein [Phycisphaerae bacterium]|nr:nucleotidyltransferase domain-containing protein [Phycisphaerae bacterium]